MNENIQLTDIAYIERLLSRHGFTFSKALGQNFIIDGGVCPQMADEAMIDGIGVIEIGPGVGVLTRELAKRAAKVVTIELDRRLAPVLSETLSGCENVEVVFGDVMKLDLKALIAEKFGGMRVAVCANLPYYITSPIIMMLLESGLPIGSITVMVQKEAADRLCAEMGSRACGAVTAAVEYYAAARELFFVGRECFMPSPKVDSCVIQLVLRKSPPIEVKNEQMLFRVIKAAFCMRRKTLSNSLSAGLALPKSEILAALDRCGMKATARPEELSLAEFSKLSDCLSQ